MIKPLFARNKELERALAQPAAAGVAELHIASPADFSVGDPVFIAEADGSQTEYLGPVTAVGADSITVAFALSQDRDATTRVWRAGAVSQWPAVSDEPRERALRQGVVAERAVGGALWSVRVANATADETLRLQGLSTQNLLDFRDWMDSRARSGLDDFTRVDERRRAARVRLLGDGLEHRKTAPGVVALTLRLAILEEGGYA